MNKTNISWTGNGQGNHGYTLNPIYDIATLEAGRTVHNCIKVSQACKYCYAEKQNMSSPYIGNGSPYGTATYDTMMLDEKRLNTLSRNIRKPAGVFICSMTDWAATDTFVKMEWAVKILEACRQSKYTCYLLTKRAYNLPEILRLWQIRHNISEWPSNVWLGFTAEDQPNFNERWACFTDVDGVLGRFPDVNVFVSYEPALGSLVLPESFHTGECSVCFGGCTVLCRCVSTFNSIGTYGSVRSRCYDCGNTKRVSCGKCKGKGKQKITDKRWLIVGGETGKEARPMNPTWALDIVNQCERSNVNVHFKQWGAYRPFLDKKLYRSKHSELGNKWGLERKPKSPGNDTLFGKAYKWTPLSEDVHV